MVSCSFICSTTIKLRWLLGLNHSVCYLFSSNCTHSCLVIFYSLHKEGKRGALLWCSVILVLITVYVCFLKKERKKKRTSINLTRMSLNTFFNIGLGLITFFFWNKFKTCLKYVSLLRDLWWIIADSAKKK